MIEEPSIREWIVGTLAILVYFVGGLVVLVVLLGVVIPVIMRGLRKCSFKLKSPSMDAGSGWRGKTKDR